MKSRMEELEAPRQGLIAPTRRFPELRMPRKGLEVVWAVPQAPSMPPTPPFPELLLERMMERAPLEASQEAE